MALPDPVIDFDALAREIVRDLRGEQSTRAASLRLGFSANPVQTWESGTRIPPADDVLRLAHLQGRPVVQAAVATTNAAAALLRDLTPRDPTFVPRLLEAFTHFYTRQELSEASGLSKHQIGRMVRGESRIRLTDLLRVLHLANRSLVHFLGRLCDLTRLPSLAEAWALQDRQNALYADTPFIWAMLIVLEHDDYKALPCHDDAWVAGVLDLPEGEVARAYARAAHVGLIRRRDERWVYNGPQGDVRQRLPVEQERRVCEALTREAARRIGLGLGTTAWRFFQLAEEDLVGVADALAKGLDAAGTVVASSRCERVVYAMVHLVPMDGRPIFVRGAD